jgi:hypothetical protein
MVDKDSQSSFLYSAKHERFDYTVGRNKVVWRCEDVLVLPHNLKWPGTKLLNGTVSMNYDELRSVR